MGGVWLLWQLNLQAVAATPMVITTRSASADTVSRSGSAPALARAGGKG